MTQPAECESKAVRRSCKRRRSLDGFTGECGFWKRVLTPDERTAVLLGDVRSSLDPAAGVGADCISGVLGWWAG